MELNRKNYIIETQTDDEQKNNAALLYSIKD